MVHAEVAEVFAECAEGVACNPRECSIITSLIFCTNLLH